MRKTDWCRTLRGRENVSVNHGIRAETPSVAIGQGYLTATPLQLANMMAAVANGGSLYRPRIVNKVESVDGTTLREYGPEKIRTINLKPATLQRVRAALADVVKGKGGTGGAARSSVVSVAGKTGTAQVVEMKAAYLKSEQLSYFNRDHAWFVAYAPVENPEVAIVVLVEHGGHGGEAAAPIAKKSLRNTSRSKTSRRINNKPGRQERSLQIDRRLISHFDWPLFLLTLAFVGMGIVTIFSANYDIAAQHAGGLPSRQLLWLGLGLAVMFTTVAFDYHYVDRLAYPFYGLILVLLILVFFVGHSGGGSQRWINLGLFRLQPSEPAKVAIVLVMAKYFQDNERRAATISEIFGRLCISGAVNCTHVDPA